MMTRHYMTRHELRKGILCQMNFGTLQGCQKSIAIKIFGGSWIAIIIYITSLQTLLVRVFNYKSGER